jgi:hypothetical protein
MQRKCKRITILAVFAVIMIGLAVFFADDCWPDPEPEPVPVSAPAPSVILAPPALDPAPVVAEPVKDAPAPAVESPAVEAAGEGAPNAEG